MWVTISFAATGMGMSAEVDLTSILQRIDRGDGDAVAELYPVVYEELRKKARQLMAHERSNHTLQATALVNEAFVKMAHGPRAQWQSRRHFYNAAAEAMRKILVDHARGKAAQKRGGGRGRVDLDDVDAQQHEDSARFIALDAALEKLQKIDQRQYWVVMYTYFSGLQDDQIAQMLGVSSKTVQRDWNAAKTFLLAELK
ncbi:MAG TPA: ECF-type sigma factor [Tepidisphaeraceae bacterium]|nr:ECF-type sigma factor [Tepidisphaeraceae bacterium]